MQTASMRFLAAFTLFFCMPVVAGAHGADASFETTTGNYVVDVGYSTSAPQDSESVIFDFQLRDTDTASAQGTDAEFSDVWVKIESEDKQVVFASGIHNAEFGGPRMSYVFPSAGTYLISVRYDNNAQPLAEASFPMTVVPAPGRARANTDLTAMFGYIVGGVILGAVGTYLLRRKT